MPRLPRSLVLLTLILIVPRGAAATTVDQVCSGDPCSLRTTVNVTAGTGTLDFGTREFRIARSGRLRLQGGDRLLVRARAIVLEAESIVDHTDVTMRGATLLLHAADDIALERDGTLASRVDLSAELEGGSIDVDAGGNLVIGGQMMVDATGAQGDAGSIDVAADGDVTVGGTLSLRSGTGGLGGALFVAAADRLSLEGPVDASGGDEGGSIDLEAGSLLSTTGATLDVRGNAPGADGGTVTIEVDRDVTLGGPIVTSGFGGSEGDFVSGGDVSVSATDGTVALNAAITAFGGGRDGQGADVDLDAGRLAILTGPIDVRGGPEGSAGSISVVADEVHAEAEINADSRDGGGDVTLSTARPGRTSVGGAVVVRGNVHAVGDGGSITLRGCDVEVVNVARLAATAANLLEASGQMTIGGTLAAAGGGSNQLRYRDAARPPILVAGSNLNPAPVQVQVSAIPPCGHSGVCGNGAPESGEECDRGPDNGKPGIGCDISCRVCNLGGDPGCPCAVDIDCNTGGRCSGFACEAGACVSVAPFSCADDGDLCNGVQTCDPVAGCVAGPEPACDDNDDCTDDGCDRVNGCVNPLLPGFAGLTCRVDALSSQVDSVSQGDLKGNVRRKVKKLIKGIRTGASKAENARTSTKALRLLAAARAKVTKLQSVVDAARAKNRIKPELADRLNLAAGQATAALDAVAGSITPGT